MKGKFSKVLVERITKYFAEYHNTAITEEQAQEYLNSFAGFYAVVTDQADDSNS